MLAAGGTVVTATRQRAHALRLAYAARELRHGRRVWRSPDVLPVSGWLMREVERGALEAAAEGHTPRLLTAAEEWFLWRESAAQAGAELELVNRAALADGLLRASRLAAELALDVRRLRVAPDTETALLQSVYAAVIARSAVLGAVSVDALAGPGVALGDARPVAFCGMLTPTPRLLSLVRERHRHGWPTTVVSGTAVGASPDAVVCAADETEELDRIAAWCRERLRHDPAGRLLVVLPGSMRRCERLAALIRAALDPGSLYGDTDAAAVGIEGGTSFLEQAAVHAALVGLRLAGGTDVPIEPVLEWLRSPVLCEAAADRARLELWLRERAFAVLDRTAFERLLAIAPGPAARTLRERIDRAGALLRESAGSARQWSERFHAALDVLGWPGSARRDSRTQQTALRLRELLEEFGQLSAAAGTMSVASALERLWELAERTAYRPADEDPAVTVALEFADPVVRYAGIWVAGLHAEALPRAPAPDPFVPLQAQRAAEYCAASSSGRLREAHGLLSAWRAAAEHLVFSVPLRADDVRLLPSPLLTPWLGSAPALAPAISWLPERLHRDDQLQPWQDAGVAWAGGATLPGGTRSLELQNDCPFRAYAQMRLGCEPREALEPGIAPDLRGRLLHLALQRLWETLRDSTTLRALSATALEAHIGTSVERAAAELIGAADAAPTAAPVQRECRRAARLIAQLCAAERERPPFAVRYLEHACELRLSESTVRVRIDRVDALEEGSFVILDYKSGQPVRADWYGERPSHPQLLAYLAALEAPVRAVATVNLTAREVGFHGIAAREGLLPQVEVVRAASPDADPWSERERAWRRVLERLAGAFEQGEAQVDPKPHACDYCHLHALCRIDDDDGMQGLMRADGA